MKTVLLTGVTGFIAKRIAFDLLEDGYNVRGTLRDPARGDEVLAALRDKLSDSELLDRLSFVQADLGSDDGWDAAMKRVDAVIHTASPFPMSQPDNVDDIVRPALEGTLRVMRAAQKAGVTRVVMTSSIVAIYATDTPGGKLTEANWSQDGHPMMSAYALSKTRAERAAWDFVKDHPEMQLSAINPVLVAGTPMDLHFGTSLAVIENILLGKDPFLPELSFGIVDVQDVSRAHLRAMELPEAIGKRFILHSGHMSMPQIGKTFVEAFPGCRATTRTAPGVLVRLLALFDKRARGILPSLGRVERPDNSAARKVLGIDFVPAKEAILRTGRFLQS
ncbi:MAG: aldehyde reductase [Pseudomonadota bacterium]